MKPLSPKPCKKVHYTSEAFAMLDIARIRNQSGRDKVPLRAYLCPMCKYWHLTSKALSEKDKSLIEQIKELKNEVTENKHYKNDATIIRARYECVKEENKKLRKQLSDKTGADERVKEMQKQLTKHKREIEKHREDNSYLISENLRLKSELEVGSEDIKSAHDEYTVLFNMEGADRAGAMYALYSGLRMFKECQDANIEMKKQLKQIDENVYSIPGAEAYCLMEQLKEQYPSEYLACEKEFNRAYGKP